MSDVVLSFDVLKQHVHRQCMEVFKEADLNSVILNLASSAETAPIEQVFSQIKRKLKAKVYKDEEEIINGLIAIVEGLKRDKILGAFLWGMENWKRALNNEDL